MHDALEELVINAVYLTTLPQSERENNSITSTKSIKLYQYSAYHDKGYIKKQ